MSAGREKRYCLPTARTAPLFNSCIYLNEHLVRLQFKIQSNVTPKSHIFFNIIIAGRIKTRVKFDHYYNTNTSHEIYKKYISICYQEASPANSPNTGFEELSASQKPHLLSAQRNNNHHTPICCGFLYRSCNRVELGR